MIGVGHQVPLRIVCPECGVVGPYQYGVSDYFISTCISPECGACGQALTIERRTGLVIAVTMGAEWGKMMDEHIRKVVAEAMTK